MSAATESTTSASSVTATATDTRPEAKNRVAIAATIALIASTVLFAGVFASLWGPVYLGGYGAWLVLFPLFIVLWIPAELGMIAALVLGIVGLVRARRYGLSGRGHAWWAIAGGLLLAIFSLPTLWFGTFPFFIFVWS